MKLKRTPKSLAASRRGEPLVVTGAVRTEDCRPLAGATVRAWQTNGDGDYGPGEGENMRCCYLQGAARTDARGRYALETVVPGTYSGGRAHIHVVAGRDDATWLETEFLIDSNEPRARFDLVLPVSGAAG
jgi:protocatechuate 3,4-dioxygenase beta subunit